MSSLLTTYLFDNEKELIEYCKQNVEVLSKACVKFSSEFWDENGIDPFIDACTIAGSCNIVFRSKYMKEDSIGVLPPNGYRLSENQSKTALKWLKYVELDKDIIIQHAGRGKEFQHTKFGRVDGYHAESNTIFEFDGTGVLYAIQIFTMIKVASTKH